MGTGKAFEHALHWCGMTRADRPHWALGEGPASAALLYFFVATRFAGWASSARAMAGAVCWRFLQSCSVFDSCERLLHLHRVLIMPKILPAD